MRITQGMASRNYLTGLQNSYARLNKLSSQVTGQKFNTISEDPSSAIRALQVRRKLAQIDAHKDNAKMADSYYTAAEANLDQISKINQEVSELLVQGVHGSYGEEDRQAIVAKMEALQQELLSLANGQLAGRYLFGGTNTITQPFTVDDATNELMYNGVSINTIMATKGQPNDPYEHFWNDAAYVDIGLGLSYDSSGNLLTNSAMEVTTVGLNFMVYGDESLYSMITDMIDLLSQGDVDEVLGGELINKFNKAAANSNIELTRIGAKTEYLKFTIDRLGTEELNLTERQQNLEFVDAEMAILNMMMQEYVYNAALQMGQSLFQPTLFNFIS